MKIKKSQVTLLVDGPIEPELSDDAQGDATEPETSDVDIDINGDSADETAIPEPTLDPEDAFGSDMKFDAPEASFDAGDEMAEAMDSSLGSNPIDPRRDSTCEIFPWTPHPDAVEKDRVVTYDYSDLILQTVVAEIRATVSSTSRTIGLKLRRLLATKTLKNRKADQERGRLDRRKLHTLNVPGRKPNKRVFTQIQNGEDVDTAVELFIDHSGSMGHGGKIEVARAATVALGDALSGLSNLKITFGVSGFDSAYRQCVSRTRLKDGTRIEHVDRLEPLRFHVYKNHDENWRQVSARVGHMSAHDNNCDGESIRWAAHRLLKTKAKRRILIVLSDGAPACVSGLGLDRVEADLKRAISQMTDLGIEVLGIGIVDHSVKKYYPNCIVIRNVSDLEKTLMSGLEKLMLGHPTGKIAA